MANTDATDFSSCLNAQDATHCKQHSGVCGAIKNWIGRIEGAERKLEGMGKALDNRLTVSTWRWAFGIFVLVVLAIEGWQFNLSIKHSNQIAVLQNEQQHTEEKIKELREDLKLKHSHPGGR